MFKKSCIFILLLFNCLITFANNECSGSLREDMIIAGKISDGLEYSNKLLIKSYAEGNIEDVKQILETSLKRINREKEIFNHILKAHKKELPIETRKAIKNVLKSFNKAEKEIKNKIYQITK